MDALGNLLIYSLNNGGFGMRMSQLCHFPSLQQGLQKCSHIRWASCNLSSSSNLPSKPSLFQGAKPIHQTTKEERGGHTVPPAGCPMDVVSL